MNLYDFSVPILCRYLRQMLTILKRNDISDEIRLKRLHDDMLTFSQQVNCMVGFAIRTCYPLMKKTIPEISYKDQSLLVITENLMQTLNRLETLTPEEFTLKPEESIEFGAGHANLCLPAISYVQQYTLPNFFFHFSIAYSILRTHHIPVGKGDFDGYTSFPVNFRF